TRHAALGAGDPSGRARIPAPTEADDRPREDGDVPPARDGRAPLRHDAHTDTHDSHGRTRALPHFEARLRAHGGCHLAAARALELRLRAAPRRYVWSLAAGRVESTAERVHRAALPRHDGL